MNGTVIEMSGATAEFEWTDETEYDTSGSRWLDIRIHNEKGEHALIRLRNPALLIFDGTTEVPASESHLGLKSEAGIDAARAMGMLQPEKPAGCFHPWPGCNCK